MLVSQLHEADDLNTPPGRVSLILTHLGNMAAIASIAAQLKMHKSTPHPLAQGLQYFMTAVPLFPSFRESLTQGMIHGMHLLLSSLLPP